MEVKPARTLRKRGVVVRFAEDVDVHIIEHLSAIRRQEGKENVRRRATVTNDSIAPSRRRSVRSAYEPSVEGCDDKLMKIDEEVIPDEFTEKPNMPLTLLREDDGLNQVGFQTPRKRKSMVLKAQESANKYSSPLKASESMTPNKTPRRNNSENVQCTPSRRVSIGGVIGATPSKGDGTPSKSLLKKRDSIVGTPRAKMSLNLQDETSQKQTKNQTGIEKTPGRYRSKTRALIQKCVAQLESDNDDFSTDEEMFKPSDESSDSSSDSSMDDEEGVEEDSESCKRSVKQPAPLSHSHSSSLRVTRRIAKDERDFEISTDAYFETQSAKQITSNNTLSRLKNPQLQQDMLHKLLEDIDTLHQQPISLLSLHSRSNADQWLFSLWEGYSILLYGLGSKRHVLQTFQEEVLCNCNVLLVNGFFPGVTIKNVLDNIITDLLEMRDAPSNLLECVDVIESAQSKKQAEPIYLLVNNIDGATFRNDKAQAIFSYLAQIPKVHLVASIDHINAPLLWDQAKLRRFNFVWWDATTFVAYAAETSYESSLLIQQSGALALSSLNSVFKSLIPNAKKVFLLIARNQLQNSKIQNFSGISFQDLYWKCRAAFLASSDRVLRAQLTEFLDHHLLKSRRGADGVEALLIPIENGVLSQFMESQEEEGGH